MYKKIKAKGVKLEKSIYSKFKEKINNYVFKGFRLETLIKDKIYILLYSTKREENDIDMCVKSIIDDLKKLLL